MQSQINSIPAEIAAIIEQKELSMQEEKRQKDEADRKQAEQWIADGQAQVKQYIEQVLLTAPDWIGPYLDRDSHIDFQRIGRGWDRPNSINFYFRIPGLAPIEFKPEKKLWRSAYVSWNQYNDDDRPSFSFYDVRWYESLEMVLCYAKEHHAELETKMIQYQDREEKANQQRQARAENFTQQEQHEAHIAAQSQVREEHAKIEEQALFDALKSDPIAIHLLKAFILLRDERSHFEQRLYEADETMYSIEDRWSRKAEELRRQADDAQRRAEDEKSRIQNDLDDAEAKLKKVKRGW